jgi:hypothetical protein
VATLPCCLPTNWTWPSTGEHGSLALASGARFPRLQGQGGIAGELVSCSEQQPPQI